MAEPGRVGDGVVGVENAASVVIETKSGHGLADGDRIRITSPAVRDKPLLAYAKSSGYAANKFGLFSDSAARQPVQAVNGAVVPDAVVDCLAKDDRAIVIGIDTYPEFKSLAGPTNDADDFAAWVCSGTGGCVADDQITVVKSPVYRTQPSIREVLPTLLEVSTVFQDLATAAVKAEDHYLGRRLYIFMSGHGILPTRSALADYDEAALLMPNSRVGNYTMHIGSRSHAEWFRAGGVFDEVVLFMDCCRDILDDVSLLPPMLPTIKAQRGAARRFYAAGAKLDSKSWERPFAERTRGVFSYVLLNALRNEALCDAQGRLTGKLLASDLHANVPKLMADQAPDIPYKEGDDLIFARRKDPKRAAVTITFQSQELRGKTAELFGGNDLDNPLDTHVIDASPWNLSLDLRRYILTVEDRDFPIRITSDPGSWNVRIG